MYHKLSDDDRLKGLAIRRGEETPPIYTESVKWRVHLELKREIALAKQEAPYAPLYRGRLSDVV